MFDFDDDYHPRRIKFSHPDDGFYHIISRDIQGEFRLHEPEKDKFLSLFRWLSRVYFVENGTFSIMSNHFHLVIKMMDPNKISLEELHERFDIYYNSFANQPGNVKKKLLDEHVMKYYVRFADVSRFMQDLKQRFSLWYNRRRGTFGHVWAERFKSILLEGSEALLACMIYVDLNSVRAGIVMEPEKYEYSGLHHYMSGGRASSWLSHNLLKTAVSNAYFSTDKKLPENPVKAYFMLVYQEGMNRKIGKGFIPEKLGSDKINDEEKIALSPYLKRIRHFTEGLFIGSRNFCSDKFLQFRSNFNTKRIREGKPIMSKKSSSPPILKELHTIRSYSIKLGTEKEKNNKKSI